MSKDHGPAVKGVTHACQKENAMGIPKGEEREIQKTYS